MFESRVWTEKAARKGIESALSKPQRLELEDGPQLKTVEASLSLPGNDQRTSVLSYMYGGGWKTIV
jgi:hypothetical protein